MTGYSDNLFATSVHEDIFLNDEISVELMNHLNVHIKLEKKDVSLELKDKSFKSDCNSPCYARYKNTEDPSRVNLAVNDNTDQGKSTSGIVHENTFRVNSVDVAESSSGIHPSISIASGDDKILLHAAKVNKGENVDEDSFLLDVMIAHTAIEEMNQVESLPEKQAFSSQNLTNASMHITNKISGDNSKTGTKFCLKFADGLELNINEEAQCIPAVAELCDVINRFVNNAKMDPEALQLLTKAQKDENFHSSLASQVYKLKETCQRLESENLELRCSVEQTRGAVIAHDLAARRTITNLQKELQARKQELNKQCTFVSKEKESSVMNYARREKELLDIRCQKESFVSFAREAVKEKDKAILHFKALREDMIKLKLAYENKSSETQIHCKTIENWKKEMNSQTTKLHWVQNKLKFEIESHNKTKEKCDKMDLEIKQAKEETEQIRKNCQGMINTYQESEDMKSNYLNVLLNEKVNLLIEKESDISQLHSFLKEKDVQLKLFETKHRNLCKEVKILKSKNEYLEKMRVQHDQKLRQYETKIDKEKSTTAILNQKMEHMVELEGQISELTTAVDRLNEDAYSANKAQASFRNKIILKNQKEQEMLGFTERVNSKNAQLIVQLQELNEKLSLQSSKLESSEESLKLLQEKYDQLESARESEAKEHIVLQKEMNSCMEEKEKHICQLLLHLEDLKDDLRIIKRKNNALINDLTRQLNLAKKKVGNIDSVSIAAGLNDDFDKMRNKANSATSLSNSASTLKDDSSTTLAACDAITFPQVTIANPEALDKQRLIEHVVRLQQIHFKKNEKLDYLNDHIQQLLDAVEKKQQIIQYYVMKDESGILASPRQIIDAQKSKPDLTLKLSIEINRKMQAVLEDTLLKNITLKESVELLGEEIQRLSQKPK